MKKIKHIFLFSVLTLLSFTVVGQITTTKVAPKVDKKDNMSYDSTSNFLGEDAYKYVGQELYLKGKPKVLREFGYDKFVLDYTESALTNQSNVYKCCAGNNSSRYNELVGKYFKVLEIVKHPKAEESKIFSKYSYLKLQEKESNDILYYEYDSYFEDSFPFIVAGFFEKQKKLFVGKEFIFHVSEFEGATDIQTGKTVTNKFGQKWKCIDLTIEEEHYNLSFVFENSLGEKTTDEYNRVLNVAYTVKEADNYKKKFGQENFDKILQGKVKIGMTKEMCKLSWGEPKKINETITAGKKTEQWIYSDNYLYFTNGILTAMQ